MSIVSGAPRTSIKAMSGTFPLGAVFGGVAAALGMVVAVLHSYHVAFPVCMFKVMSGFPCLTCGGTRAVLRLLRLDVFGAVAMNPLVGLALVALVPWSLIDAGLALRRRALVLEIGPGLGRALRLFGIPLLFANWAYLVAVGR